MLMPLTIAFALCAALASAHGHNNYWRLRWVGTGVGMSTSTNWDEGDFYWGKQNGDTPQAALRAVEPSQVVELMVMHPVALSTDGDEEFDSRYITEPAEIKEWLGIMQGYRWEQPEDDNQDGVYRLKKIESRIEIDHCDGSSDCNNSQSTGNQGDDDAIRMMQGQIDEHKMDRVRTIDADGRDNNGADPESPEQNDREISVGRKHSLGKSDKDESEVLDSSGNFKKTHHKKIGGGKNFRSKQKLKKKLSARRKNKNKP